MFVWFTVQKRRVAVNPTHVLWVEDGNVIGDDDHYGRTEQAARGSIIIFGETKHGRTHLQVQESSIVVVRALEEAALSSVESDTLQNS